MRHPRTIDPSVPEAGVVDRCGWCQGQLPLRNKKFCSRTCSNLSDHALHPRIGVYEEGRVPREAPLWKLVLGVLTDGQWHTAHDIALTLREDKHSVVTRISQLKARNHRIEVDLPVGNSRRPHRYRLL